MAISRAALGVLLVSTLLYGCGGGNGQSDSGAQDKDKSLGRSDKSAAASYQTSVQELYVAYFGRPADPTGLANFETALLAANAPTNIQSLSNAYATNAAVQALINSFGSSAESQALYGAAGTGAFVTAIFQNVLGRPPQQAGLTYWSNAIASGALSQGDAALAIMAGALTNSSAQGVLDAQLIANRLAVAGDFTAAVPVAAYSGAAAASSARSMLSEVTSTTNVASFESTVSSTIAAIATASNQKVFESFALNGGESVVYANLPYGGGNMVSGTNYIFATTINAIAQSPATAGAQSATPFNTTLDSLLSVPATGNSRVLQGGQVWLLSNNAPRLISYVGSSVQVQSLASDGQTVLRTTQFSNYSATSLSGAMNNSPEELFASVPIDQWVNYNNFSANAQWKAGAAYLKKQGAQVGNFIFLQDCTNTANPVNTSGTSVTPCQTGATLNNFFPITLLDSNAHPTETDFASGGTISTVQGLPMWIAASPLAQAADPTQTYRIFVAMNGNVYMGVLENDGTPFLYGQADGSVVNYSLTLNQTALNSVQQGVITGASVPGTQAGIAAAVSGTPDLFGIGGSGINGALAPADLRQHYNVPAALTGAGQTVAIVDWPGSGNVADDLNVFSQYYNLPACTIANSCFQHIDLSNGASIAASADAGAEVELDTQMVHAMAPGAKIILVTAKSTQISDIYAAVAYAASLPSVTAVSMSFTAGLYSVSQEAQFAAIQKNAGPLFFASSGDNGSAGGAEYPASSQYVTAVGGTTVHAVNWVSSASETAWQYSSGGFNANLAMPSWQTAALNPATISANFNMRAVPDVAAVADNQHSGVSFYYKDAWVIGGGTSVAAPIWAGVGALLAQSLVNQNKSLLQLSSTTPGGFNSLLYQMSANAGAGNAFYDIVSGSNNLTANPCAMCNATVGYDDVTGLGAPSVASMATSLSTLAPQSPSSSTPPTATTSASGCGAASTSEIDGLGFTAGASTLLNAANTSANQISQDQLTYNIYFSNPSYSASASTGSLEFQLFAFASSYTGTQSGVSLGTFIPAFSGSGADNGNQLYNFGSVANGTVSSVVNNPSAGTYCLTVFLEEYTQACNSSDGYCVYGWVNLPNPVTFK